MLSPSRQQRFTIEQVEQHQWVHGVFVEEFPPLDEKWTEKTLTKYVAEYNLSSVKSAWEEIESNPFDELGGIFNIEKHVQQMKEFSMRRATSACKMREMKAVNQSPSLNLSQISTPRFKSSTPRTALDQSINRQTPSVTDNLMLRPSKIPTRPKTTQGKRDLLKPFETRETRLWLIDLNIPITQICRTKQ